MVISRFGFKVAIAWSKSYGWPSNAKIDFQNTWKKELLKAIIKYNFESTNCSNIIVYDNSKIYPLKL